jgi:hypothetical protein
VAYSRRQRRQNPPTLLQALWLPVLLAGLLVLWLLFWA